MEKKIIKEFIDLGLGFPVKIHNAPMVKVRGVWALSVDHNLLNKSVAIALAHSDGRITGNQLKFIRYFFKMTLKEFGARFGVAHPTVISWEKKFKKPTHMEWGTEKDIRMEIVNRIYNNPELIGKLFSNLTAKPKHSSEELDLPVLEVA